MDIIDKSLHRYGFALHWLRPRSKRPIGKDWQSRPRASLDVLKHTYRDGYNVGVRLGEWSKTRDGYLHVLDIDIRVDGVAEEAWSELESIFPGVDFDTFPSVISGSGGDARHVYFVTDSPFSSRKIAHSKDFFRDEKGTKHWEWEIELFGTGKQVAMPPSIHPDSGKPYRWEREFDITGPAPRIDAEAVESALGIDGDEMLPVDADICGVSMREAEDFIYRLPDYWVEDRDTYLTVGMGLHHEFSGSEDARKLWFEWSRQSEKFNLKDAKRDWRSFKNKGRAPITFRTVIDGVKEGEIAQIADEFDDCDDPFDGQPPSPSTRTILRLLDEMEDDVETGSEHPDIDYRPKIKHRELKAIPEDLLTVPGRLGEIVRYYNETAVKDQPQFAVQTALAIGSVIVGRNHRTDQDNYSSVYLINLAETASGKEHAKRVVERYLDACGLAEELLGPRGYASKAGLMSALLTQPRHITVMDEWGAYMSSARESGDTHKKEVFTMLMELFGRLDGVHANESYSQRGLTAEQIEARKNERVYRPAVTVIGMSVPESFYSAMTMNDVRSGLLNRFLPVMSVLPLMPRNKNRKMVSFSSAAIKWGKKYAWPVNPDDDSMDDVRARMEPRTVTEPITIPFTRSANEYLDKLEMEQLEDMERYRDRGFADLFGRTVEFIMRVSLIVALSCESDRIRRCDVEWAARYVQFYHRAFAAEAMRRLGQSEHEHLAELLYERIQEAGKKGMTERELTRSSREFASLNRLQRQEVTTRLTRDFDVAFARRSNNKKDGRGRKAEVYILERFVK